MADSFALQATQTLQAIDDMHQLGRAIGAEDPCNPMDIATTLVELTIELISDFIAGVIQLAGMAGKNALFLILAILQEVYGPSILLGIQGAVGFIMGNVFGTILQGIAMLLSSVDGIWLILMYLAAGVAMEAVKSRQDFIDLYFMNLIANMIKVLQLLDELNLSMNEPFDQRYEDIRNAYKEVRMASQILGVEVDKRISEGSAYLDVTAVEIVRDHLEQAINLLMGANYQAYMEEVNSSLGFDLTEGGNFNFDVVTDWNFSDFFSSHIAITGASSTGINSWTDFQSLLGSLRNEMWNVDRSEGISTGTGSTAIQTFMDSWLGQLNPAIQAMAYLELIRADLKVASERAPVFGSQLTKFYELAEGIAAENAGSTWGNTFGSSENFQNNGADVLGNIIGDLNSPDLKTLQSSNIEVNIAEKAIRMLKVDLGMVSHMGGMLEWMIRPIFKDLEEVRNEMKSFLEREDGLAALSGNSGAGIISDIATSTNRLRWSTKLEWSRASLLKFTTTVSLPGMDETNFLDQSNAMAVEEMWDTLVNYLENTTGDVFLSMEQYPGYQPAEVAFEMLQQLPHAAFVSVGSQRPNASTLMPSIENVSSTQGARDLLLAYLQEVKSQFLLQKTIDQKVYNDCTTIRNKIEENPAFQMMMNLWTDLTSSLAGTPLDVLTPELAGGSLSTLVGATSNVAAIAQNPLYRNLGPCIKGGILPAELAAQGIGLNGSQVSDFSTQVNIDKATMEAKKLQDQALQSLSGLEDNAKYAEYEQKKTELLINMQNQTAKLQDTIVQITTIYNIVGSAVG